MALDLVRLTESHQVRRCGGGCIDGPPQGWAPPPRSLKVAESMYKYLQTHIEVLKLCIIKSANK